MNSSHRNWFFAGFSLLLLALFSNSIRALIAYALDLDHTNASQTLLVPFISGVLIYLSRKSIFQEVRYSVLPGTIVIVAGVVLFAASKTWGALFVEGDHLALAISSLVLTWLGGFLFFYGPAAFKAACFPLLFLVFCSPLPSPVMDRLIDFLRRGSTDVAHALLQLSGTPVYRQGFTFTLPDLVVEVAPECSGIRSGISLLILALLAGHLFLRSPWRWVALLVATIPILFFKNALRITVLSLLAVHVDKGILESRLHREGGIPFFALGLVLLYPILTMLIKSERKTPRVVLSTVPEADV
jgi:exosortase